MFCANVSHVICKIWVTSKEKKAANLPAIDDEFGRPPALIENPAK